MHVRALTDPTARGTYIAADGHPVTVRELGEAASRGRGLGGAVAEQDPLVARDALGAAFADALLLDQQASGARARTELGWAPKQPLLTQEYESGSYATK